MLAANELHGVGDGHVAAAAVNDNAQLDFMVQLRHGGGNLMRQNKTC